MELRAIYPEEANAGVESVMLEAGEKLELATIYFIVHELGRDDLAHLAVDGAAKTKIYSHAQWPRAVMKITGPGSCRLSAIRNAVLATEYYARPSELLFLIVACSESGSRDFAMAEAAAHPWRWIVQRPLQEWINSPSQLQLPPVHPLLLDPRCPSWAVSLALGGFDLVQDPYNRWERPVPWAVQAIYRGDRVLLKILRDLDNNDPGFSFERARAAAIRAGNLPLLQWLLSNVKLPVESTLLDEALYYHQFEIAEWLAVNCLDGCRQLNWDNKVNVSWFGPCDLTGGILLDWIEGRSTVRDLVDFGSIAYHAAKTGVVEGLRQLHTAYPEL